MKVAIVHDWLVSQRGGENVLDAICELFPKADLFTLLYVPNAVSSNIVRLNKHVSFLQKIPQIEKKYRHLLPLMPMAIERFDLKDFDLIISSSHCVAKGVQKREGAVHISYIHAPMRYMWDRFDEYFSPGRYGIFTRTAARICRPYLQSWDKKSATRVDHFIANSQFIAEKVEQYYGQKADVVYPFCESEFLQNESNRNNTYLMVTALVPYKRVDLAIETFNRLKKPLLIVGDGPDSNRLKKQAGPNIEFVGSLKRSSLTDLYSKCRALIFPGIEDFGIVPLEAMAAGMPVIAFAKGGALETVTDKTGVFFKEPTVDSLSQAIEFFEQKSFSPIDCRNQAHKFTRARFQKEFLRIVKQFVEIDVDISQSNFTNV